MKDGQKANGTKFYCGGVGVGGGLYPVLNAHTFSEQSINLSRHECVLCRRMDQKVCAIITTNITAENGSPPPPPPPPPTVN